MNERCRVQMVRDGLAGNVDVYVEIPPKNGCIRLDEVFTSPEVDLALCAGRFLTTSP